MATYLIYKDVVPNIEDITYTSFGGAMNGSSRSYMTGDNNRYAFLEHNFWISGEKKALPTGGAFPFVSDEISDANGDMTGWGTIDLTFDYGITSAGLTVDMTDGRAKEITVYWYRNGTRIVEEVYNPDSDVFIIERPVNDFDEVTLIFRGTVVPLRRIIVNQITVGIIRRLGMHVLQDVSLNAESDISGLTLPISTLNWTITSREAQRYTFQSKQPVQAYHDDTLIGTFYLESSDRRAEKTYAIKCNDAFGVLDKEPFAGGVYTNISARALANQILDGDFALTEIGNVEDKTLSGAILAGTKRTALQQVFFAWGVVAVSDRNEGISVVALSDKSYYIGADKTLLGVSVKVDNTVTEIRLTSHAYTQSADGDVEIGGVKYTDTQIVHTFVNPNATVQDQTNIKEITDATLISEDNAEEAIERLYQYYLRKAKVSAEIVWKEDVWLGDYITQISGWNSGLLAYVEKMNYSLSNTILVKCESRSTGDVGILVGDFFRSNEARLGEINA